MVNGCGGGGSGGGGSVFSGVGYAFSKVDHKIKGYQNAVQCPIKNIVIVIKHLLQFCQHRSSFSAPQSQSNKQSLIHDTCVLWNLFSFTQ